jgi:hypothetical protein
MDAPISARKKIVGKIWEESLAPSMPILKKAVESAEMQRALCAVQKKSFSSRPTGHWRCIRSSICWVIEAKDSLTNLPEPTGE